MKIEITMSKNEQMDVLNTIGFATERRVDFDMLNKHVEIECSTYKFEYKNDKFVFEINENLIKFIIRKAMILNNMVKSIMLFFSDYIVELRDLCNNSVVKIDGEVVDRGAKKKDNKEENLEPVTENHEEV